MQRKIYILTVAVVGLSCGVVGFFYLRSGLGFGLRGSFIQYSNALALLSVIASATLLVSRFSSRREKHSAFEQVKYLRLKDIKEGGISREDVKLLSVLVDTSAPTENAIEALSSQLEELKAQILKNKNEIIEVQKIDPVLEATLRVGLENLAERIKAIEEKQLAKWDVSLICGVVISGALLVATTVGTVIFYVVTHLK